MASARPRDWVTARLHVSAPGQATTSRASSAPGSAMPMASRRSCRVASCASVRPRKARFWRLVMRTSTPSSRMIEARARNCSAVMSPRRTDATAETVPLAAPRTTLASAQRS